MHRTIVGSTGRAASLSHAAQNQSRRVHPPRDSAAYPRSADDAAAGDLYLIYAYLPLWGGGFVCSDGLAAFDIVAGAAKRKADALGAELLREQAVGRRISEGCGTVILRIAQNREARGQAMDAELVGSAGDRFKLQNGDFALARKLAVAGKAGLSGWIDPAQQTFRCIGWTWHAANGKVDCSARDGRMAKNRGNIELLYGNLLEFLLDIRIFCEDNNTERVAIQTCEWMNAGVLTGALVVAKNGICQRTGIFVWRWMDQHSAGFVNS